MSTVDTLLASQSSGELTITMLTINEPDRSMLYDGKMLLGVAGDHKAKRVYFEVPKKIFMDQNIDLSSENIKFFVKFQNATLNTYIYECTDKVTSNTDIVIFSWVLTEKVTAAAGKVKFMVCIQNIGTDSEGAETIQNEWHSSIYEGEVLKGIEVTSQTPEIINDQLTTAYQLTLQIQELNDDVNSAVNKINNAVTEVTGVTDTVSNHETRIKNLENKSGNSITVDSSLSSTSTNPVQNKVIYSRIVNMQADIDTISDNLDSTVDRVAVLENSSGSDDDIFKYTLLQRETVNLSYAISTEYGHECYDILKYISLTYTKKPYSELMIVIRIESTGGITYAGLASNNTPDPGEGYGIRFDTSGTKYGLITMKRTKDGYIAWQGNDGSFLWLNDVDTYRYIKCMANDTSTTANVTVVVYGRGQYE